MCPPQGDYQGAISIAETGLKFCLLESTEVLKRLRQRRTIHLQEKTLHKSSAIRGLSYLPIVSDVCCPGSRSAREYLAIE